MDGEQYTIAFIFGVGILAIFAWNQFNSPSYPSNQQFARILETLRPRDLRRGEVVFTSYLTYLLILVVFYWVLCTYAPLHLFNMIGLDFEIETPDRVAGATLDCTEPVEDNNGSSSIARDVSAGDGPYVLDLTTPPTIARGTPQAGTCEALEPPRSPLIPLTVSLAIAGIVPNIRLLADIEEKVRFAAHRIAGIPGHLMDSLGEFNRAQISLEAEDGISNQNLERIERYVDGYAAQSPFQPDDVVSFRSDLCKFVAFETWFTQYGSWPSLEVRSHYHEAEDRLHGHARRLFEDLDLLTMSKAAQRGEPAELRQPVLSEMPLERWNDASQSARMLAADIGALMIVYSEQAGDPDVSDSGFGKFARLIQKSSFAGQADAASSDVFVSVIVAVVLVAAFCGAAFGLPTELMKQQSTGEFALRFQLAWNAGVSAVVTYGLATLVAVSYQQARRDRSRWQSVQEAPIIVGVKQLSGVFLVSFVSALVCLVAYNISTTIGRVGMAVVVENWQAVVVAAATRELGFALMAGAFAVLAGIGIDSARNLESLISRAVMPWWAGGILFVAGWTASAMASEFAGVQEPDRIRMLASALQGGLIGLVALFAVRLTFKSRMEEALRLHQASSPDEGAMGSDNPGHA